MHEKIINMLNDKIDEVYLHFQEKLNIQYGDISPDQAFRQDEIVNDLASLIEQVLKFQMEDDEEDE